jgi:hypothetical protein
MGIQRLRNLTTGRLHTNIGHVYEDLEWLIGEGGIMTHMIPRVMDSVMPYLKAQTTDHPHLWDNSYDPNHKGDIEIRPLTPDECKAALEAYAAMSNPLAGKTVVVVNT